ncbi:MAG: hypothetical protein KatS3mg114_1206 [Planctomycetaceae bacterium]|nr:MAG: hypothetical protein KatS3mg114_1206 [Planctomycetaceae bacterium]
MQRRWGWQGVVVGVLYFTTTLGAADNSPPPGFRALFNGKDFTGWHGVGTEDPRKMQALTPEERQTRYRQSLDDLQQHWKVENGELVNDGKGLYMTTDEDFGDYELYVSWKIIPLGDSGVYLKGYPQVQIWDTTEAGGKWNLGANKGSGGLWNNSPGAPGKDPLRHADKPLQEWNTFRIIQVGARTTVYLNDKLVVDRALLENYFDRGKPLVARGPIQLQTHGNEVRWKNIYIRELSPAEANAFLGANEPREFVQIFNGKNLDGWTGAVDNYEVTEEGSMRCKTGRGGVLHTVKPYADFIVRLEFKLPPAGNNGLAIRYPGHGDAAYDGMTELQVLDSEHPKYANLDARQYHGSAYGMVPAHRGYLRPVGQWNFQEVTVQGSKIRVELNGQVILDTDLATVTEFLANRPHPGKDLKQGFFGFAGHNDPVEFRNIRIRELSPATETGAAR